MVNMKAHPYIPNSVPEIKRRMLEEIGVERVDELFASIPSNLRLKRRLQLPDPTPEMEVKRHISTLLSGNRTCLEIPSFLGAGCWPHFVPDVCNEINSRSEFLTAYTGDVYSDLGRFQALFEFQSMIGELVGMDAVTFPLYDWSAASGDAIRMALLTTGRRKILVPETIGNEKLSVMRAHCANVGEIELVECDSKTGQLDLDDLEHKISPLTAGVYIENPAYLGFIETEADEICRLAHENEAMFVVGVEPLSLGLLKPPGEYGADIVCGEGQPLGLKTNFGGALLGFLACRDQERFLSATGHRLITITKTRQEGEWGFAFALPKRSMYAARENAATFTGTSTVLWAITAAVYLSVLGPHGIKELAKNIMQKSHYAIKRLSEAKGIVVPAFNAPHFEEFTVRFGSNKTVREINRLLLKHGIQGGKDLTKEFPQLGNTALYCVTEVHTQEDIDKLATTLEVVTK
jgi:glycine dehydrogenase subunit 1